MRPHARRIEACLDLISRALRGEVASREELVEELRRVYAKYGVEPIRGRAKINIYDKELCTVYVVARYGLGLDPQEYGDFYERLLSVEVRAERAAERLLAGEGREAIIEEMGSDSEEAVFRVARLVATAALLGFRSDEDLARLLDRIERDFPNLSRKIMGFKKFFVAFRVAQAIASGDVDNRIEKEALKHALCLRLNAVGAAPSDDFVRLIASEVLGVGERAVSATLALKPRRPRE